jgi:hypothetical protein
MAGIKHLKEIQQKKGDDFLLNLLNNFVIINEDVKGNFFGLKKDRSTDRFKYFKKSGEITYVDRMLMKFYNPAIAHFETISEEKRKRIPSNFYFGFQYITKKDGGPSGYSRSPKNNLILSYIHRLDDNGNPIETMQTKSDLDRWAYYLEVEAPPIIFEGMLDDDQKNQILEFVHTPLKDLEEKFKTVSFTKHIINILSPDSNGPGITNKHEGDISGIVFRFYDENDENPAPNAFLAKLIDPIFKEKYGENQESDRSSSDYIWLIVIDLMNHIEMYSDNDLMSFCENEEDYDSKYISLINHIFKDFINEYQSKYEGLTLEIPEYLKSPEFQIDFELIRDPEIINLIKGNETYQEMYRILSNFFRKKRKRSSSGFFGPELLDQLNLQVEKIKRIVMGDVIYEGLFPSFGEFIGSNTSDAVFIGEHENFKKNRDVISKPERVNVIIGSFQPIHNGHIKAAEALKAKNGLPCVLVAIRKGNRRTPFSEKSTRIMLEKVQQSNSDLIKETRMCESDSIKDILSIVSPQFTPVLWGSSEKRINDFVLQMEFIKKRNIPIRLSDDFNLIQVPQYINSDDVRNCIVAGDFNTFKGLVPSTISSEFFNMKKELTDLGLN